MLRDRFEYDAVVRQITDGDTFVVDIDLGLGVWLFDEELRLVGPGRRYFNAYETRGEERPLGLKCKRMLRSLMPVGTALLIKTYRDSRKRLLQRGHHGAKGKYGRYLMQVLLPFEVASHVVGAGLGEWR